MESLGGPGPATAAGRRWASMIDQRQAQSLRLGGRASESRGEYDAASVASFRSTNDRWDDRAVVDALAPLVEAGDVFVDVGAGAGRFALPLAGRVGRVVAVEPSEAMRAALEADARASGIDNLDVHPVRWQDLPALCGDVAFSAHAIYTIAEIEPFLHWMTGVARRWSGVLLFTEPPQSWLAELWPLVHGERRLAAPHLPQLLDVVDELGLGPAEVTRIPAEPFALGPPDAALRRLQRRLYVEPDSAADHRLREAMATFLVERDGALIVKGDPRIELGLVRWRTSR